MLMQNTAIKAMGQIPSSLERSLFLVHI